jgi:type III pantothenate kinase
VNGVALASVVPAVTPDLLRLGRQTFGGEPLRVSGRTEMGLRIAYQPATDVGADRLVDAVAAVHQFGAPCIIIDFGTATTFNAVDAPDDETGRPIYLGGAICLGIGVSLEALFSRAAKIPPVEIVTPPRAIGDNTVHALQSGIVFGYVAQVEGMVARFRAEAPGVEYVEPHGAFYFFFRVDGIVPGGQMDGMAFCEQLMQKEGVALVPGGAFGDDRWVRLSYAVSDAELEQALDRILGFIKSLAEARTAGYNTAHVS